MLLSAHVFAFAKNFVMLGFTTAGSGATVSSGHAVVNESFAHG